MYISGDCHLFLKKMSGKEPFLGLYFLLKGQRELETSRGRLSLRLEEQKGLMSWFAPSYPALVPGDSGQKAHPEIKMEPLPRNMNTVS